MPWLFCFIIACILLEQFLIRLEHVCGGILAHSSMANCSRVRVRVRVRLMVRVRVRVRVIKLFLETSTKSMTGIKKLSKKSLSRGQETTLKHDVSTFVFHCRHRVLVVESLAFFRQTQAMSMWPNSSNLVSSDQSTDFQKASPSSKWSLAYFSLAWRCRFFSRGVFLDQQSRSAFL